MPIDAKQPETPGWWLERLLTRMRLERPRYDLLDSYYRCTNGIPVNTDKATKEAFQRLMRIARSNWAELAVQAPLERMQPVGFKTGAPGDWNGDQAAWQIWQGNELDANCPRVFEASLSMSMAYMIVGSVDPDTGVPLITPEDPREVTAETDPKRRSKALAALKVFRDEVAGVDRAYLYLPGVVYRAWAPIMIPTSQVVSVGRIRRPTHPDLASAWEWESVSQLPANIVPVVPFPANPTIEGVGVGEFETHLPILDRINYLVLQELQVATLQAFRQRAIKGDLPVNDETGNPIDYDDIFAADPGALWQLPEGAEMWESGHVDLGGMRQLVRDQVQDFAALSGTPLFYLTPEASDGSAEGAALARERLIFKTRRHIVDATEPLERAMTYAFLFAGDTERGDLRQMEVLWAPPDRWSLSEQADAASKAMAAGLTWKKTMELIWQLSPQEIAEMEAERAAEQIRAQAAGLLEGVIGGASPSGVAETG